MAERVCTWCLQPLGSEPGIATDPWVSTGRMHRACALASERGDLPPDMRPAQGLWQTMPIPPQVWIRPVDPREGNTWEHFGAAHHLRLLWESVEAVPFTATTFPGHEGDRMSVAACAPAERLVARVISDGMNRWRARTSLGPFKVSR